VRRNENGKIFGILPDQADYAPWNCARTAVAVDEQVYPILREFLSRLQVVIHNPEGIIGDLNLMTRTGGGDVSDR
jgi:hypothetical protein